MKVFTKIVEIQEHIRQLKRAGKQIGFVPTMGYLHAGHLSLIEAAVKENDLAVVSIFVNPKQFGPREDFAEYPRDLERDLDLISQAGGEIVFIPETAEIYPENFQSYVEVREITANLCGAKRPGHFLGVATVVNKLFNIIKPDKAYFGQKDAQQCQVIKRMVLDLNMDVEIIICPIVREADGLALSSRNVYLNQEERKQATVLSQALFKAQELIRDGERDSTTIKNIMEKMITQKPLAKIDYISIVDETTLQDVQHLNQNILIALAVKFGNTRLIDNIILEVL